MIALSFTINRNVTVFQWGALIYHSIIHIMEGTNSIIEHACLKCTKTTGKTGDDINMLS